MNTKEEHPHWLELVSNRYNDRYMFLLEKLQDQLTDLLGELPSVDFFNECLKVLESQDRLNPVRGLYDAIERTYGIKSALHFIGKNREISRTASDLKHVLTDVYFMITTQDVFEDLKKIQIYCN